MVFLWYTYSGSPQPDHCHRGRELEGAAGPRKFPGPHCGFGSERWFHWIKGQVRVGKCDKVDKDNYEVDTLHKNHEVAQASQISNIMRWLRYLAQYQISNIMRWLRYLAQVQLLHPDEVGEDTGSKFLYEVLSQ